MKKIFAFVLALSVMSMSYAQQKMTKEVLDGMKIAPRAHKMEIKNFDKMRPMRSEVYTNRQVPVRTLSQVKKDAAVADTACYLEAYRAYRMGYYPDGMDPTPALIQQWNDSLAFVNISVMTGDQFGWFLGGEMMSQDTIFKICGDEIGFDGNDEYMDGIMPELAFANGASYEYGKAYYEYYAEKLPQYADYFQSVWMTMPVTYKYPLTWCDFYNAPEMNYGSAIGWNLTYWAWDMNSKSYMFGSNFDPSLAGIQYAAALAREGLTKIPDTIATEFGMDDMALDIDTITVGFYAMGDFLPAGSQIKIDLHPITYDPQMNMNYIEEEVLASGVATINDTCGVYTWSTSETGLSEVLTEGVLTFPIKATIRGRFMAEISGFNDNNANIGFFADNVSAGTVYHICDGNYVSLWYANLSIAYNASLASGVGFDAIKAEKVAATKGMKNGRLFIEKNGRRFNALGAEVR